MERVSGLVVEKRSSEITADWKIENPGKVKRKIKTNKDTLGCLLLRS